jgi:hypothetical protein
MQDNSLNATTYRRGFPRKKNKEKKRRKGGATENVTESEKKSKLTQKLERENVEKHSSLFPTEK